MDNQYKLVYASNMNDAEFQSYWTQIERENSFLFEYINANLQKERNSSIRSDVLKFISENIEYFPKNKSVVSSLYGFLCNISITPKHWEIIFSWFLDNNEEDVKDFVIVFNCAVEKDMPLNIIKEFFAEKVGDFMTLYERVAEYEPANEVVENEEENFAENKDVVMEVSEIEGEKKPALEHVKIHVETEHNNSENGYVGILNQFVNILSLNNRDPQSIHEAQDHMNGLFAQMQLITTQTSSFFTEILREWENDKTDIQRLNSFCEIQRNIILQLQNKVNALNNENICLEEKLAAAELALGRSEEINKKARELMEITSTVPSTTARKPNYPYFVQ